MLRTLLFALLLPFTMQIQGQEALVDSLKKALASEQDISQRIETLGELSRVTMNSNLEEADQYGLQMIREAEMSRDRKLMIKSLLANGERALYLAAVRSNIDKAINYYNQALELARKNKLEPELAECFIALAKAQQYIPDADKALNYCNQAFSLVNTIQNDSLESVLYGVVGDAYLIKKERLLAMRNYFNGLRIAEALKNPRLLRMHYKNLSTFYATIDESDKAIDYAMRCIEQLKAENKISNPYQIAVEYTYVGNLYRQKKNFDVSKTYYEKSIALADSLKHPTLKLPAYISILNQYIETKQPQKALEYFNGNDDMKKIINIYRVGHVIDQAYGYIYMDLGKYDSAVYYYSKAAPFFEKATNSPNQVVYYTQLSELYKRMGNYARATEYLQKAERIATEMGDLEVLQNIAAEMDTVLTRSGNLALAKKYASLHYVYKDSLQKLGEEKELMQLEIDDEQRRQERLAKEAEERKRARHQIQYVGITAGIVVLFIALVLMGMLRVSATTIRIVGFFGFLMLFEFIFLVFKKNIHGITEGEPILDLAFMIGIAALLVPLHHWLEHRVVKYLTSRQLIIPRGKSIWNRLLAKQAPKSN